MKRLILLCAVVTACMGVRCSCTSEDDATAREMTINPTITRVTGMHFDAGDRIGLTVLRTGKEPLYLDNCPLTYDGTLFGSKGVLWYNDLNERSTLWAYHPYDEVGTPSEWRVSQDQSSGCASSDLLAACRSEVVPASSPVEMVFRHLMTKLSILVRNDSDATVTSVLIEGTMLAADVDYATLSAAGKGPATGNILTHTLTPDSRYEAVIVPQSGALSVTVAASDGKTRTQTLAPATLLQGKVYTVEITLTNIDIEATVSGQIEDWADAGKLNPDGSQNPSEGTPGASLEYGGATYGTAVLRDGREWMTSNLRYLPQGKSAGDDPAQQTGLWLPCTEAGAGSSQEAFLASQGLLYDVPSAAEGLCPAGWHIPTGEEFEALMGAYEAFPAELEAFVTLCGIRTTAGASARYNAMAPQGAFTKGYLMSASPDPQNADRYLHLCLDKNADPASISLQPLPKTYGIPVRCIKDRE